MQITERRGENLDFSLLANITTFYLVNEQSTHCKSYASEASVKLKCVPLKLIVWALGKYQTQLTQPLISKISDRGCVSLI